MMNCVRCNIELEKLKENAYFPTRISFHKEKGFNVKQFLATDIYLCPTCNQLTFQNPTTDTTEL